jgi:DNA invertase Pin-like site-specific DNA recombinase
MMELAYSYVRFSFKRQGKGSSIHRQTQDTVAGESPESWCRRNGVKLDTSLTFRDLGVSAYTGANAKQGELRAFLEAVKTGRILPGSYLLVERVDRITRQGVDEGLEIIKSILKAGVSIVTLANGRVYGPASHKKLKDGLLELQMYLEQAQEYSEALSARIAAAWEVMRGKARKGILVSARMPPWCVAVGEKDERRAVGIPDKVALVQRIFDMAISGMGITKIARQLNKEKIPPIHGGKEWARISVRRLLLDRTVLGEYQPYRGRGKNRKRDGEPIEGYYPAVVSLEAFQKAKGAIGSRKNGHAMRTSEVFNLFTGLLKDARSPGKSYFAKGRVEDNGRRHHVYESMGDSAATFPMDEFETAILGLLREIEPRELFPPDSAADEVLTLSGALTALEQEIGAIEAEMDREYSDTLNRVLRKKEARRADLAEQLREAQQRAGAPLCEAWGETQSILEAIAAADDATAAKLRLRTALRRVVDTIQLLVVRRGRARLACVQMWFAGAAAKCRTYLVFHQPIFANQLVRKDAINWAASVVSEGSVELDLRNAEHVQVMEAALSALDLSGVEAGEDMDIEALVRLCVQSSDMRVRLLAARLLGYEE